MSQQNRQIHLICSIDAICILCLSVFSSFFGRCNDRMAILATRTERISNDSVTTSSTPWYFLQLCFQLLILSCRQEASSECGPFKETNQPITYLTSLPLFKLVFGVTTLPVFLNVFMMWVQGIQSTAIFAGSLTDLVSSGVSSNLSKLLKTKYYPWSYEYGQEYGSWR